MNCYWCKAPDPPVIPDSPQAREYAQFGMVMRRCTVCGYYQNHVGDDEPLSAGEVGGDGQEETNARDQG